MHSGRFLQRFNPAPPGQIGGQYKPLSESDLENIYRTALRLLDQLGMGEVPARLHDDFVLAGGRALNNGRICLPNAMVEDAIAKSPKTFVLHGRDPDPVQSKWVVRESFSAQVALR